MSGNKDATGSKSAASTAKNDKVKIIIPSTEVEAGDVYLSLNGKGYLIQRDVEVEVPASLLNVLNDATIKTFRKDPESGKIKKIQMRRYAYQLVQ